MGVMSKPEVKDTAELLKVCKKLTESDLKRLMGVSDAIAKKDVERYKQWDKLPCKAACLAMDGLAYRGFSGGILTPAERKVAQSKVRILSGLYGVLKPFDAIRPYRLEMGSKLKTSRGESLYAFWGNIIASHIRKGTKVIINAASQEYWKSVVPGALGGVPVVTMEFPGPAAHAKKARGLICRYAVQKNCKSATDLKAFTGQPGDSYVFDTRSSTVDKYVFRRVASAAAASKPENGVAKRKASTATETKSTKKKRGQ